WRGWGTRWGGRARDPWTSGALDGAVAATQQGPSVVYPWVGGGVTGGGGLVEVDTEARAHRGQQGPAAGHQGAREHLPGGVVERRVLLNAEVRGAHVHGYVRCVRQRAHVAWSVQRSTNTVELTQRHKFAG